jgi:hypothetical protein
VRKPSRWMLVRYAVTVTVLVSLFAFTGAFNTSHSGTGSILGIFPLGYAFAQPNSPADYLTYQGQLTLSGSPVTSATSFNFSIYTSSTLSTNAYKVYCETQTITPDSNGIFTALIGSGTACTGTSWSGLTWPPTFSSSSPYYLNIIVGSTALTPRTDLTAAPYLDGQVSWGQLITFPSGCSAGSAVTSLGASVACAAFMSALVSFSTSCGAGSALNSMTATLSSVNGACVQLSQYLSTGQTTSFVLTPAIVVLHDTTTISTLEAGGSFNAITGCTAAVAASTTYYVDVVVYYLSASAVSGVAFGITGPSGASYRIDVLQPTTATAVSDVQLTATSVAAVSTSAAPTTAVGVRFDGFITTSSTAGTFGFLYEEVPKSGTTSSITIYGCDGSITATSA